MLLFNFKHVILVAHPTGVLGVRGGRFYTGVATQHLPTTMFNLLRR